MLARAMPQWIEIYNNRTLTDAVALVDDPATTAFEGPQPATPTDPVTNNTSYDTHLYREQQNGSCR